MTNRTTHENIVRTIMAITDEEYRILYIPSSEIPFHMDESIADDYKDFKGESLFGATCMWTSWGKYEDECSCLLCFQTEDQSSAESVVERVENFLKQEKDKQNARQ